MQAPAAESAGQILLLFGDKILSIIDSFILKMGS
jgi:hypothetical protein